MPGSNFLELLNLFLTPLFLVDTGMFRILPVFLQLFCTASSFKLETHGWGEAGRKHLDSSSMPRTATVQEDWQVFPLPTKEVQARQTPPGLLTLTLAILSQSCLSSLFPSKTSSGSCLDGRGQSYISRGQNNALALKHYSKSLLLDLDWARGQPTSTPHTGHKE